MSNSLGTIDSSICDTIRAAITEAIAGAQVAVRGGGGHYEIEVCSEAFAGKSMVQSQRLVYSAIAHLMAGEGAPVHAVASLTTKTP